uniref:Uncharacterized protein n=1 Tax=Anguilla anguilla TaxID=7936 RepID=A0A0E9QEC9_ANGAN
MSRLGGRDVNWGLPCPQSLVCSMRSLSLSFLLLRPKQPKCCPLLRHLQGQTPGSYHFPGIGVPHSYHAT